MLVVIVNMTKKIRKIELWKGVKSVVSVDSPLVKIAKEGVKVVSK